MLSRFRLNQLSKCRRFIPSRGIPITLSKRYKYKKVMDGNEAAAHIAYALSDTCFIYPITPASPMAEHMDEWASSGRKNLFNTTVAVEQMQSEAGAAGAVHGAINTGCLTSTFTSSQGLMLMVPNLFRMANEGVPTVIHVASRSMIKSLGILYLDHSDVMAVRSTGFAILNSGNVQEAMDMALVAHLSALEGKIPFIHFFDGFRTSHEVANVDVIEYSEIEKIFNYDQLERFRKTGFNPSRPEYRGGATINDVYWQWTENINEYFEKMPDIVENVMKRVESITGRKYSPFEYYGHPEAEHIIVLMGSSAQTAKEYIDHLNNKGEKVGMVQVRLYRPFSVEKFLSSLPPSWKKMTVLDRCREFGTVGQPLYLDVAAAMQSKGDSRPVLAGIYGIGGKDFTPGHLASVFENMKSENPKNNFSVGIKDDKFGRSLPEVPEPDVVPPDTKQLLFFGMGGDGTLGANREAISIISENTNKNVQGYFIFDAKKTNGWTISNLRFGNSKIRSEYEIQYADYVAVHHPIYVNNMPVLDNIREGGIFVLNSPCKTIEDFEKFLPAKLKKIIATKKVKFYNIDATNLASEIGMKGRINMIMQAVFFKLNSELVPEDVAKKSLKEGVEKMYGLKGKAIVESNYRAIDIGFDPNYLKSVDYPMEWANLEVPEVKLEKPILVDGKLPREEYVEKIVKPYMAMQGKNMPVSFFDGIREGLLPVGTSKYEKRGVANNVPVWNPEKCIKCNICSFVCPQACIRPFLLDDKELETTKIKFGGFKYLPATKQTKGFNYTIQVSPLDCMDCTLCKQACPQEALTMQPIKSIDTKKETELFEHLVNVPERGHLFNKFNIVGSQFQPPLVEFSTACEGCPQVTYTKILTQLFGHRMMIANATGCSIIWSSTWPSQAFTTNQKGEGPSWGNSLFEDNAEYGYGQAIAVQQKRRMLKSLVEEGMKVAGWGKTEKDMFQRWLDNFSDGEESYKLSHEINDWLDKNGKNYSHPIMEKIYNLKDMFTKPSIWIIGGDGFAYDIGFAGLDHVLAQDIDINMFIFDNQSYANTGFQKSKATPYGTKAKFAAKGKRTEKKPLGLAALQYGHVYVAQVAMGADRNQFLKAIKEAEAHKGPSLIIAYSPCTGHGMKGGMSQAQKAMKEAVDCGFWNLWRYDPSKKGDYPFMLDSKSINSSLKNFLMSEARFSTLCQTMPEEAERLQNELQIYLNERFEQLKRMSENKYGI